MQTLAIRRLADKRKDVVSLRRLVTEIQESRHLFTREIFVSHDGLPYDYASVENRIMLTHLGKAPFWGAKTGPDANRPSEAAHKFFDDLCGIDLPNRRRTDQIPDIVFGKIVEWFDESGADRRHMQFTFTLTDKIDPTAIYAALVATLVFAWNIYVWRNSGPRLKVTARMNMLIMGGSAEEESKVFLIVDPTNIGSKKTTITNVLVLSYANGWRRFRKRPNWTAVFNNVGGTYPVPYVLDVGHNFSSKADQVELVEKIRDTYFYAGVAHSFANVPVLVRVKYSDPMK
jgi:hypothetical protein